MLIDRFSRTHTSSSRKAVEAFETAVAAVAAHRPSAAEALGAALNSDPDLVSGLALKGFAALILGRAELLAPAADAHRLAHSTLIRHGGGTADERLLVNALGVALTGHFRRSADLLEAHLAQSPSDLLLVKLSQSLRFMAGDGSGMLAATSRITPRWTASMPGAGFVLGCHAFALEEAGFFVEAERVGRSALALEPTDAWGLHAVSHVHEMQGRNADGIAQLEASRPMWSGCNNFRFHMAWHLALFHLEVGRTDRALELYDSEVRPEPTDDFRDVANASSLLWRLKLEGVSVGARWNELAEIARRRADEATLVFATLHNLLAAIGAGDRPTAANLVETLERRADGAGDQAEVADRVGVDLARLIAGMDAAHRGDFARLARELPRLGGSNAQRDVFLRTLTALAPPEELAALLDIRRRLKREDRFSARMRSRFAGAERRTERRHRHLAFAAM
jgi:hypothetical protein